MNDYNLEQYPADDYSKLEFIHFAIQEVIRHGGETPELAKALEYVEDLREPYLEAGHPV